LEKIITVHNKTRSTY